MRCAQDADSSLSQQFLTGLVEDHSLAQIWMAQHQQQMDEMDAQLKKLQKERPPNSIFHWSLVLSVFGQFSMHLFARCCHSPRTSVTVESDAGSISSIQCDLLLDVDG